MDEIFKKKKASLKLEKIIGTGFNFNAPEIDSQITLKFYFQRPRVLVSFLNSAFLYII